MSKYRIVPAHKGQPEGYYVMVTDADGSEHRLDFCYPSQEDAEAAITQLQQEDAEGA